MTEAEWLACDDPFTMVDFVWRRVTDRKFRLFTCACAARYLRFFNDPATASSAALLERHADGLIPEAEQLQPNTFLHHNLVNEMWGRSAYDSAARATSLMLGDIGHRRGRGSERDTAIAQESAAQSQLVRDLLGNPFRRVSFDVSWRTEAVVALARGMYETRDFAPMPVLADALDDAGCTDLDILAHCRGPGPHVRGCWVVDLVLGKE